VLRDTWTIPQLWMATRTLSDLGRYEDAQIKKAHRKPNRGATPDNVTRLNERQLKGRPDLMQG